MHFASLTQVSPHSINPISLINHILQYKRVKTSLCKKEWNFVKPLWKEWNVGFNLVNYCEKSETHPKRPKPTPKEWNSTLSRSRNEISSIYSLKEWEFRSFGVVHSFWNDLVNENPHFTLFDAVVQWISLFWRVKFLLFLQSFAVILAKTLFNTTLPWGRGIR